MTPSSWLWMPVVANASLTSEPSAFCSSLAPVSFGNQPSHTYMPYAACQ